MSHCLAELSIHRASSKERRRQWVIHKGKNRKEREWIKEGGREVEVLLLFSEWAGSGRASVSWCPVLTACEWVFSGTFASSWNTHTHTYRIIHFHKRKGWRDHRTHATRAPTAGPQPVNKNKSPPVKTIRRKSTKHSQQLTGSTKHAPRQWGLCWQTCDCWHLHGNSKAPQLCRHRCKDCTCLQRKIQNPQCFQNNGGLEVNWHWWGLCARISEMVKARLQSFVDFPYF